jgi:hypothetical protein
MARVSELELEERARRLEGQVLRGVTYQGTTSLAGEVHTATHAVHLELDHRIEITATDVVGIVHGSGISLRPRKVLDPAYGSVVDASATPGWQALVGTAVRRAIVHWDDLFDTLRGSLSISIAIHADHLRRRDYPATLELGFAHGTAFVSAARLDPRGKAQRLEPELVIFFSDQSGRALGLRA